MQQVKPAVTHEQTVGKLLLLERFQYQYELNKLNIITGKTNSLNSNELMISNKAFCENKDYDLWMVAEIHRLQGEQHLARGNISEAKKSILESIDKNKKEAKTWMAYAKLNEVVLQHKNDERAIQNSIKGYFMSISLQ